MVCPRCGGDLETYTLADRTAVVCESCEYVGVPADHTPEPSEHESWDDALRRFRARRPESGDTVTVDGTTYRVPVEIAEEVRGLTEKQRAVVAELLAESDPGSPDRTHAEIAEAAGVHRSYAGEVIRSYGELAAALATCDTV